MKRGNPLPECPITVSGRRAAFLHETGKRNGQAERVVGMIVGKTDSAGDPLPGRCQKAYGAENPQSSRSEVSPDSTRRLVFGSVSSNDSPTPTKVMRRALGRS